MALVMRYWVPNAGRSGTHTSGRTYPTNANQIIDVPASDADGVHPDGAVRLGFVGTTADRPVADGRMNWPPKQMYDTTLGKPIFLVPGSVPARWIDINGSPS
jgi:hypothetical protein